MHIDLTQILTCPFCGPGHGLVALVERMEERRILEGRLDCPICERRHALRGGVVLLDSGRGGSAAAFDPGLDGPEAGATAAALLGPPRGRETLLLAGGARGLGAAIARLRPEAEVVTFGPPPASAGSRLHPVVAEAALGAPPFRGGSFHGAVLHGADREWLETIARSLRPGAHLVVLSPGPGFRTPEGNVLAELAADERAWVGRPG